MTAGPTAVLELVEFVVNQELCRKQWLDADQQYHELTAQYSELEHDNEALKTKLKHARSVSCVSVTLT